MYNGENVTTNLTAVNSMILRPNVSIQRMTSGSVLVAFSSGVSITVTLQLGILSFVASLSNDYQGMTIGLQGNFDRDETNDFITRSGTMIPNNSTDAQIFEFGQSCKTNKNTTYL